MLNILSKLLIGVAITVSMAFGADDPFLGTWKLNVEKSTLDPAQPKPKSMTETYEPVEGGVKWTATVERLDGTPVAPSTYTAKYDGEDYPVKMGTSDSIAIKRVDANMHTFIVKENGKVVMTGRERVSGNTLTKTAKGTEAGGKPLKYVLDKQ